MGTLYRAALDGCLHVGQNIRMGKNGKQYVVIDANESMVAFSLP